MANSLRKREIAIVLIDVSLTIIPEPFVLGKIAGFSCIPHTNWALFVLIIDSSW